jgi:hypothetical protein
MQKNHRLILRRIGRFFPFISATLVILLAFQNCGKPQLGANGGAPFDPLVYKIDLESDQAPAPLHHCFDSQVSEESTIDVTDLFFPAENVQVVASQESKTWQDCVNQIAGLQVKGILVNTSDESERLFAVKVIRESFPATPILTPL